MQLLEIIINFLENYFDNFPYWVELIIFHVICGVFAFGMLVGILVEEHDSKQRQAQEEQQHA